MMNMSDLLDCRVCNVFENVAIHEFRAITVAFADQVLLILEVRAADARARKDTPHR